MYSNNIVNFQESMTILNAHMKKVWKLIVCTLCIYIYIYTHVNTSTHTHINVYTHTHIYTQAHTHTHIYIYIYIYTPTHTHIYIYSHTCTNIYIHTHTCIETVISPPQANFISKRFIYLKNKYNLIIVFFVKSLKHLEMKMT